MGLDMFLSAEQYLWSDSEVAAPASAPTCVKGKRVKRLQYEAAYWRKANHIHQWFVTNVQDGEDDCDRYSVSLDQIKELVELCKKVLVERHLAAELLPVQAGFFFGSTEYGEYYFGDLEETIKQLEPFVLDEGAGNLEFTYHASW